MGMLHSRWICSWPLSRLVICISGHSLQRARVKQSGVLTEALICKLYNVTKEDIVTLMFFDPARAFKLTLKRSWAQGSVGERDTFGAQQHAPLLTIEIPGV